MTAHNIACTYPSKGRFFLFKKEQHEVMEKVYRKERSWGALPYLTRSPRTNLPAPVFSFRKGPLCLAPIRAFG